MTAYEMRISDWSSDVCSSDRVEADHRLVALEEARQLLLEAHVELVDPRVAVPVAVRDAAAVRSQVRIVLDELVERRDLAGRRRAVAHDRIVDQRDVRRILEDPVAVRVAIDGPGVRQAGTAVVERGNAGLVVTEQRLLPTQRGLDRVTDLAAGPGRNLLVRIDARDVLEIGRAHV